MNIPYVIEDCPIVSKYGIRIWRDREPSDPNLGVATDVIKIQYAIDLERRLNAALKELQRLKDINNNLGSGI